MVWRAKARRRVTGMSHASRATWTALMLGMSAIAERQALSDPLDVVVLKKLQRRKGLSCRETTP